MNLLPNSVMLAWIELGVGHGGGDRVVYAERADEQPGRDGVEDACSRDHAIGRERDGPIRVANLVSEEHSNLEAAKHTHRKEHADRERSVEQVTG